MPKQLQKILDKIIEWWKKFSTRQRILLISIIAVVVLALVILAVVVSRPNYVILTTCDSATDATKVSELLEEEGIKYTTSTDGFTYYVDEKNKAKASILLGTNEIPTEGYDIDDVVTGSFSMTTSDREKLYVSYLEKKIGTDLAEIEMIDSATVTLNIPDDDGTILSSQQDSSCSVTLGLNEEIDEDQAAGLARYVATALGDYATDQITIIDRATANVLYSGADENSSAGIASTQLSAKQKQQNLIESEVKSVLVNSKVFSDVQVGMNLDMSFDNTETSSHKYGTMDGTNKGPITSQKEYNSSAQGGAAATPGTDTNDDTTIVTQDGDITSQEVSETSTNFAVDETITKTTSSGGKINYETSTISVVANRYRVYDQETMEANGELDGTTWEEFKAANADAVEVEDVDGTYVDLIAKATGIDEANISFHCYEQPSFIDKDTSGAFGVSDILQIVLAVLIFALLGYVVFRSTWTPKKEELEPELAVEPLLESTLEVQEALEDIGYAEKSETRILIEKFVDENPDAAALLLRNWLNEEWE